MRHHISQKAKGYTRRELLVTIGLLAVTMLIFLSRPGFWGHGHNPRGASAKTGKAIYNWLQAYANDNNGKFPEAKQFSNEAYRQLFVKRYLDDEQGFAITNDPWLNHAPGGNKKPDNDIGVEPDFARALDPGECSWAYVTGLNTESPPHLPIMGNAFSESIGVYSRDKKKKGGVFLGQKAIWVSVGGSTKVVDLSDNLKIEETKDGRRVNIYQSEWGTKPEDVKNPAN
ncbi:MAG: hypothetical protein V4726_05420 [Verrucomicrobiota bacterium]